MWHETEVQVTENLDIGDHKAIRFEVSYRKERHVGEIETLNFKKLSFDRLRSLIGATNWDRMFIAKNTEEKLE